MKILKKKVQALILNSLRPEARRPFEQRRFLFELVSLCLKADSNKANHIPKICAIGSDLTASGDCTYMHLIWDSDAENLEEYGFLKLCWPE